MIGSWRARVSLRAVREPGALGKTVKGREPGSAQAMAPEGLLCCRPFLSVRMNFLEI